MKGRTDSLRGEGGGVTVLIVSLIKPWEAQGGRGRRKEAALLNVRSERDTSDLHAVYTQTQSRSSAKKKLPHHTLKVSLCQSLCFAPFSFHSTQITGVIAN